MVESQCSPLNAINSSLSVESLSYEGTRFEASEHIFEKLIVVSLFKKEDNIKPNI